MKNKKKLGIGIISLTISFLLFGAMLLIQRSLQKEPEYKQIVCLETSIHENQVITKENYKNYLTQKEIPVTMLPENYISDLEQLIGYVSRANYEKGTILTEGMLYKKSQYEAQFEDVAWISSAIAEIYQGVAGSIREGDYIDIYVLSEIEKNIQCEQILSNVRVEGAYTSQGEKIEVDNENKICQMITFPIERNQIEMFYEALAKGEIRIAKSNT